MRKNHYRRRKLLRESESLRDARTAALAYEAALPPQQRKRLGQYFSGLKLGRLLAHLALDSQFRTVLDPMAGHGDLLDATWEAASERGIPLDRLDAIEIDETTAATCRSRLAHVSGSSQPTRAIISADAFDPASIEKLPRRSYDLVITNPPYVRYQSRNTNGTAAARIRAGLITIITACLPNTERTIWRELAEGYSGLADLSVPAWLLAAAMVRPAGHLALVVPATWRTRDYADVIRYLLLRGFSLECIVEDKQPGWFSDALVRTHLIVARRLSEEETTKPLTARNHFPNALWLQVAPEAADAHSLVGASFAGHAPDRQFAAWVDSGCNQTRCGITTHPFDLHDEWAALERRITRRSWYQKLEGRHGDPPLFQTLRPASRVIVPDILRSVLPDGFLPGALVTLEEAGVSVGQGLRTGCNKFFYVSAGGPASLGMVRVKASSSFGHYEFFAPAGALRPVLRRQSEMKSMENGSLPDGRVLDLRGWVLPEDFRIVEEASEAYGLNGEMPPQSMPDELAAYVRLGAAAPPVGPDDDKKIPDLSAVRTNVRLPRNRQITPRFWYMLPDFAPRHLPAAFVPRINHGLPWTEANLESPVLIDANFSTFWGLPKGLTPYALKALLNSVWCRALMEALGTVFGGGALKLEATHLRQLPVPVLSDAARAELTAAGRQLTKTTAELQSRIDAIVLDAFLPRTTSLESRAQFARALAERANNMSSARQAA